MFVLGDKCIDTKTNEIVTVLAYLHGLKELCVVEDAKGNIIISVSDALIEYNPEYFEKLLPTEKQLKYAELLFEQTHIPLPKSKTKKEYTKYISNALKKVKLESEDD